LLGLDADPIELPKAEARLRAEKFGPDVFTALRSNYAGLPQAMAKAGFPAANCILADLGVSSMQLDNPARGFSTKQAGPLDLRMNPQRGQSAAELLAKVTPDALAALLLENSDEPHAALLAGALAGRSFETTIALAQAIRRALPAKIDPEEREISVRRVFQALRIAVNDEFSALDMLLRHLPACLAPGGRVAILTFHSGEDRRVKKAFAAGLQDGTYVEVARELMRPTPEERHANPRSTSAKLRWARKA
jgi:16S rRNA (cytosine1402-N4)-methyltransferase